MRTKFLSVTLLVTAGLSLTLTGCGGTYNLWPFGKDDTGRLVKPANSTEYQCNGGKRFYVRTLADGAAVWVIYPDRQVRLDKTNSTSGTSYSNGIAVFEINGSEASLTDGPALSFTGCKTVAS